ncbi:MAG: hypothetical protein HC850_01860 [Rhodomicrobium sp.]|nr:hypothetical protein [Rhodomicrobium sp.]
MRTAGQEEQRSISFSGEAYLQANPDLQQVFGSDAIAAVQQYITQGRNEDRWLRQVSGDVNGDSVNDVIRLKPGMVTIDVLDANGAVKQSVSKPDLETAVAEINKIGILSWIAADDVRMAIFGTDLVSAQQAISSGLAIGDPNASIDVFSLLADAGDLVQKEGGDLAAVLTGYIDERRQAIGARTLQSEDGKTPVFVADYNNDGYLDALTPTAEGWTAQLGGADRTLAGQGTAASTNEAIKQATLSNPNVQLQVLQYIASYGDLIEAFGTDVAKGYDHYVTNGQQEKREISFSAADYLAANPEIREKIGNDPIAAAKEYIETGSKDADRPLRLTQADVTADGIPDVVVFQKDRVSVGVRDQNGSISRVARGETLNSAIANANAVSLLSWIAADQQRIVLFGTDITKAYEAYSSGEQVGTVNGSVNPYEFIAANPDLVRRANGDLAVALSAYINSAYGALTASSEANTDLED